MAYIATMKIPSEQTVDSIRGTPGLRLKSRRANSVHLDLVSDAVKALSGRRGEDLARFKPATRESYPFDAFVQSLKRLADIGC